MNSILLIFIFLNTASIFGQHAGKNLTNIIDASNHLISKNQTEDVPVPIISVQDSNGEIPHLHANISSIKARKGVFLSPPSRTPSDDANVMHTEKPLVFQNVIGNTIKENNTLSNENVKNKQLKESKAGTTQSLNVHLTNLSSTPRDINLSISSESTSVEINDSKRIQVSAADNLHVQTILKKNETTEKVAISKPMKDKMKIEPKENIDDLDEIKYGSSSKKPDSILSSTTSSDIFNFSTTQMKLNPVLVPNEITRTKPKKIKLSKEPESQVQQSNTILIWTSVSIAVLFCSVLSFIAYKRMKAGWYRRHYERVDFLIDGMYDDL